MERSSDETSAYRESARYSGRGEAGFAKGGVVQQRRSARAARGSIAALYGELPEWSGGLIRRAAEEGLNDALESDDDDEDDRKRKRTVARVGAEVASLLLDDEDFAHGGGVRESFVRDLARQHRSGRRA